MRKQVETVRVFVDRQYIASLSVDYIKKQCEEKWKHSSWRIASVEWTRDEDGNEERVDLLREAA